MKAFRPFRSPDSAGGGGTASNNRYQARIFVATNQTTESTQLTMATSEKVSRAVEFLSEVFMAWEEGEGLLWCCRKIITNPITCNSFLRYFAQFIKIAENTVRKWRSSGHWASFVARLRPEFPG